MSRETHAQAVIGLLDADNASPALVVQDGKVTDGVVAPYALVYFRFSFPDATDPAWNDLTFDQKTVRVTATVHSVGDRLAAAARAVGNRVEAALLNVTPAVAGRSCTPIRWVDGQDPRRDEETLGPIFDQVDVYEYYSFPG